jgi:ABC-type dipeptide/oligopeptide/nickel transport system permease component
MLLAARAGMLLLLVSCLLGIWVGMHGEMRIDQGLDPTRLGAAGVPKFPHGVVIHAVQWLPVLAWALRRAGIATASRVWLVAMASAGSTLFLIYALVQTALGRSRFDTVPATAAILVVLLACLGVPVVTMTWAWLCGRKGRGAV